jgi:hypothetical protein
MAPAAETQVVGRTARRCEGNESEMTDSSDDQKKFGRMRKLIAGGAEIAGGAVGGALGFLAAGPAGAAALGAGGAAAAFALTHIGEEVSERLLAPREKVRIGGVLALASAEIGERIANGDQLRTDGFFPLPEATQAPRSDAEEVVESIILKTQREPEEKKLPYMAHLISSVAFDPSVSAFMAHQVVKMAEQLTYRQLCILRLAATRNSFNLRSVNYRGQRSFSKELYQVLYECLDLYHRALVNFGGEVAFGPTDIEPSKMAIQALGVDLHNLMRLDSVPEGELMLVAKELV